MTFDTVKINIDKKVDKMLRYGRTVDAVIQRIEATKEGFIRLLGNDAPLQVSERNKMCKMYIEYSDTKIKDMVTLNDYVKKLKN